MKRILPVLLILAGCQSGTTGSYGYPSMAHWKGQSVQAFMNANAALRPVNSMDTGANSRSFMLASDPVVVTTTLPAYTPPDRAYNNAALGAGFNNLNRAVGSTPEVSRSSVQQCRARIDATNSGKGRGPSAWIIDEVTLSGNCR